MVGCLIGHTAGTTFGCVDSCAGIRNSRGRTALILDRLLSGRETPLARYVAAASLGAAGCPGAAEVVPVAVAAAVTPLL